MGPRRRITAAASAFALTGCVAVATGAAAAPAKPEIVAVPSGGSITVHWRGNGHGHGMSQYGARGAAIKGLNAAKIVAFYFPGTTLATLPSSRIRVNLSEAPADTTVFAGTSGLALTGYETLPTTGYRYFRLVPSRTGLRLQGQREGKWHSLKNGLPARADFHSSVHWVQALLADGSSTRYHGRIGAVRVGSGEATVNRLSLDQYVQGSVPREVPTSWEPAAIRAQAIAARSYAEAVRASAGTGSKWDICDTTMCQAYGGMAHYSAAGQLLYTDDHDVLTDNANRVLRYEGAPVLAQYSASNGGATVYGGEPYLVGKSDPYDSSVSGDPYLQQSRKVTESSLASYFHLKKVTSIEITKRDGNGPWGGRIVSAVVNGTTPAGKKAHLSTTGFDLGTATGVWTDYLRFS
ncbi:MAG TPA: SpoIID/LytB domain-containing protein [Jatrophihabitantaceae bacterium]|jgi:SpoIID/LytB domain protein|nr:SpoIID/LytB domain-containing protein [Jatrophihabitantaceae bacterium]